MKDAFELREGHDHICAICSHWEEDFEVGGMYGLCLYAREKGRTGPKIVKPAYHICNEEVL